MLMDTARDPVDVGSGAEADDVAVVLTRAELGALLTARRQRSGRSLRDLATAIGSSASTLSGWCRAENLPFPSQFEVFRALLRELGIADPEPWIDALVRVREAGGESAGEPPYPGLDSFGPGDSARFFGRHRLVVRAEQRIADLGGPQADPRVLVVVGASGAGKSSLLHAGLLPRLAERGHATASLTPGDAPLERLAAAQRLLTRRSSAPATPDAATTGPRAGGPAPPAAVLVVDQLEELFTAGHPPTQVADFLGALESLAAPDQPAPCIVILALRLDLYPQLVGSGRFRSALEDQQLLVGPMNREELREAIVGPARAVGVTVEDELVAVVVDDLLPAGALDDRHDPGGLALLSHALRETWRVARRGRLTLADYHATGGIAGAVERSAEAVYQRCDEATRALVPAVLLRLVQVTGSAVATRRIATLEELAGLAATATGVGTGQPDTGPPAARHGGATGRRDADRPAGSPPGPEGVTDLVDRFVAARLLTIDGQRVTITHEALLVAWPRLRGWIEDARDELRLQRRLTEATRLWLESDRDSSALARGVLLAALLPAGSDGGRAVPLTADERRFLAASHAQAEADASLQRERARRLRLLAGVATAIGVLAVVLAVVAVQARGDAVVARDEARSRELALAAQRLAETDPGLAAQLAVIAYDSASTPEARSAVLQAAAAPSSTRWLGGAGSTALVAGGDGLLAVSDAVTGSVRLLTGVGALRRPVGMVDLGDPEREIYALASTADGGTLLVGDTAAEVSLWDVSTPATPRRRGPALRGPDGPIQGLAVAPDGGEFAAVGLGAGVFRWQPSDPPRALPLLPADEITWSVAYHPRDPVLAVGRDDGVVALWATQPEASLLVELTVAEGPVFAVAFDPAGRQLLAGSRTGTTSRWDVTDPTAPVELPLDAAGFDSWVNTVAVSPDGRLLAAGSSDATVRLWAADSGEHLVDLPHPAAITTVAFEPDGAGLLTAAADGTARRWELASALPRATGGRTWGVGTDPAGTLLVAFAGGSTSLFAADRGSDPPLAVLAAEGELTFSGGGALAPDGTVIANGTVTGEVVLHDVADPRAPRLLAVTDAGAGALVESVAFSADGRRLVAGGADTNVRVWDLTAAGPVLRGRSDAPGEIVLGVDLSPDGQLAAAASADNRIYLLGLADPTAPTLHAVLEPFTAEAFAVAFDPDGRVLAAAGSDAIVVRYDVSDPSAPVLVGPPLTGPTGRIFDLAVESDRLAAAAVDGSIWVWDLRAAAPRVQAVLSGSSSPSYAVAFGPDGDWLVAAGADAQLRTWTLASDAAVAALCAGRGDALSALEWARYVPDRPYRDPCPAG